jgi:transposase
MNGKSVIGVDVGKFWLDVAREGTEQVKRLANTAQGIDRFVAGLDPAGDVVVFERTGGYERLLQSALAGAGVSWAVVHSRGVRAFGEAKRIKAKTDAIDARLLRSYGRDRLDSGDLRLGQVADGRLSALLARRAQLRAALHAERCRLDVAATDAVRASSERMTAHIEAELDAIEAELSKLEADDQELRRKQALLCEQIGVAQATARTLLAELPELGRLNAKEIACLAGLAPRVRQSGTIRRWRGIVPGRTQVRSALYYPTLTAMRRDPDLAAFAGRLRQRGKPGKVIIVAVMRKLLVRLNARIRDAFAVRQVTDTAATAAA